jgi:multidrug efflux pump
MVINLKSIDERGSLSTVIAACRSARAGAGVKLYLQPVQDLTIDTETGLTPYRFALKGADQNAVNEWGNKLAARSGRAPLRNAQVLGAGARGGGYQPRCRRAPGRDGAEHRQCALRRLWPAHHLDHLHPVEPEPRDPSGHAPDAVRSSGLAQLYIRSGGTQVPLGTVATMHEARPRWFWRARPVPGHHRLRPGAGRVAGPCGQRHRAGGEADRPARLGHDRFLGSASAFQSALANEGVLVAAAIVVVYIVLGVLYESFIHPVTILSTLPSAGIGALIALLLSGYGLGVIGIIGIVLLIGIVKKNAIMMIDFAVAAMEEEGLPARRSAGGASAFPPDHDDDLCRAVCRDAADLWQGMGHELRQPLGLAIAGGLILSQVLTLFTTPVIFLGFETWRARLARKGMPA